MFRRTRKFNQIYNVDENIDHYKNALSFDEINYSYNENLAIKCNFSWGSKLIDVTILWSFFSSNQLNLFELVLLLYIYVVLYNVIKTHQDEMKFINAMYWYGIAPLILFSLLSNYKLCLTILTIFGWEFGQIKIKCQLHFHLSLQLWLRFAQLSPSLFLLIATFGPC